MKSNFVVKFASFFVLLAVLAGLFLVLPSTVARAVVSDEPYDYCDVSGATTPSGANGHYLFSGIGVAGRPTYAFGSYTIGYSLIATQSISPFPFLWMPAFTVSTNGIWNIKDPEGVNIFRNYSDAMNPPSSGWGTSKYGVGNPSVICGYNETAPQPTPEPTKSPVTYVYGDGKQVNLSCQKTLSFDLVVPGGDIALLNCPVSGLGSNNKLVESELPAGVTGGTFVAAFDLEVNGGGAPLSTLSTPFVIAFKIPEGATASQLAILFWDAGNSQWVELPTAVNLLTDKVTDFGSGRKVYVGTHQYTRTHVAATVNFTGIFVLVQK